MGLSDNNGNNYTYLPAEGTRAVRGAAAPQYGQPFHQPMLNTEGQLPGEWNEELCGCANDPTSCFTAWFCPCIQYARNINVYEGKSEDDCFNGNCLLYAIAAFGPWPPLNCLLQAPVRRRLRERFNLNEGCSDCCVSWACSCCALSQEYREMKGRGLGGAPPLQAMQSGIPTARPVSTVSGVGVSSPPSHAFTPTHSESGTTIIHHHHYYYNGVQDPSQNGNGQAEQFAPQFTRTAVPVAISPFYASPSVPYYAQGMPQGQPMAPVLYGTNVPSNSSLPTNTQQLNPKSSEGELTNEVQKSLEL